MRGVRARSEEMCHVKPDSDIGDCEHSEILTVAATQNHGSDQVDMCADDVTGVLRRILRLLCEHFCEKFGVLTVERPVGRCCGSIAGNV